MPKYSAINMRGIVPLLPAMIIEKKYLPFWFWPFPLTGIPECPGSPDLTGNKDPIVMLILPNV
jgi:hypothetical protein